MKDNHLKFLWSLDDNTNVTNIRRKKMIATEASALNKKNIEMTQEVMCNNLIYWAQDLFNKNL